MRWTKYLSVSLVLIALVDSCLNEPTYNIVPYIEKPSVSFKRGTGGNADTLTFVLAFRDGDGDLGINGDETNIGSIDINSPFFYLYDTTSNKILYYTHESSLSKTTLDSLAPNLSYVTFKAKRLNRIDTLPDLSCKYWTYPDTLFFWNNPYYYNFFVDSYIKNSSGVFELIDPYTGIGTFANRCEKILFNSRFHVLSTDLGRKSPIEGTLTYKAPSAGIYFTFQGKTVQFRIHIMDRAFHRSDTVKVEYTF